VFLFNTAITSNIDTITDFSKVTGNTDKIDLSRAIYTGISNTATVAANQLAFHALGGTQTTTERLFYDAATGGLYYDQDGSGAIAAVQIAILGTGLTHPTIAATDFVMVA
jgi:Ca2+-binding RTX toxin-like protein